MQTGLAARASPVCSPDPHPRAKQNHNSAAAYNDIIGDGP
ncbi:hypothetical protein C7S13_8602 [Burkholderia cepacia]|nr:hypothetical protein [Burkholderia cepacia]